MIWLIAGLLIFHGIHSLRMIAPGWRDAQVASMGEGKWKGLYSLVSLFALVLMIWGYSEARPYSDIVYVPPDWGRHLAWLIMLPAFILMTFNMRSSRLRALTHHPFLTAVILWSIAHLLANGDMASVLLFGSFLIWAVFTYRNAVLRNSDLPPVAPLAQDIGAIVAGILLWAVFMFWAHNWLFGVSPVV